YPVHEQELLAFVYCLKKWRHYLDNQCFTVYTDNRSLETLQTNRNLSKRQIRWLELFQSYIFKIHHIPREKNQAADALSKRPFLKDIVADGGPTELTIATTTLLQIEHELHKEITQAYKKDEFWKSIVTNPNSKEFVLKEGLLYTNSEPPRLCVPRIRTILNS